MATILGIDTGSWRTRFVRMEGSFRRFTQAGVREVPTIWDGAQPQVGPSLGLLAEGEKLWAQADKIAALPMELASIRLVRLPFADKAAIERTLPSEVESSVPYEMEEMVLLTRILEIKDGRSTALALLSRREDIRARIDTFANINADPRMVGIDVDALSTYSDKGVQVVVDIGHRRTLVALCQNGNLIGGRVLDVGSAAWTAALVSSGLSWEEAEHYKHGARVSATTEVEAEYEDVTSPGTEEVMDNHSLALQQAVSAWGKDLRTLLVALEDLSELGIDEILLTGGGSQLMGLSEHITALAGVPVREIKLAGGLSPSWALSLALARAGAGEGRLGDFRVGDLTHHAASERLWRMVSWGGGAVMLATLAGIVLVILQLRDASARVDELETKIKNTVTSTFPDVPESSLSSASVALSIMQERTGDTQRRVEALGSTIGGLPPTLDTLKQISASVPAPNEARIDVKELSISEDSIVMKAETDSYETAAKIEEALRRLPRFSQARKGDEKKTGDTLQFTLTIPLGIEAPAEAETTPGGEG